MRIDERWNLILDAIREEEDINIEELQHLIFDSYECLEYVLSEYKKLTPDCLLAYKYIGQAAFYLSMNYLSSTPESVSDTVQDFLLGLCHSVENGFNRDYYEHSIPLGLNRHTPAGCAEPEADMSTYESFLKAFNDNVEYLKTRGYK